MTARLFSDSVTDSDRAKSGNGPFHPLGVLLCLVAWLAATPSFARPVLPRDVRNGALDATSIVIVRQKERDVFTVQEVLLGERRVGDSIKLAGFQLKKPGKFRGEVVQPITDATRILLFLESKKNAPGEWSVVFHGSCYFWVDEIAKLPELRQQAKRALTLRQAWHRARDTKDVRRRVESLWPHLWCSGSRVSRRTAEELKKTAPVAGDYLAERLEQMDHGQRMTCISDAYEYGGDKLHAASRGRLTSRQRAYERFLETPGARPEQIEDWSKLPRQVTDIWGELYYGLVGLSGFKRPGDLPYIRELAAWSVKYRFKQTCDAALSAFRDMPHKQNLPLIEDIWKEFQGRPYKGNELSLFDVTRALRTHKYPETVPILVQLLGDETVGGEAQSFLSEIVGKDLGKDPQAWLDWYGKQP